jgi:hypothetical protein
MKLHRAMKCGPRYSFRSFGYLSFFMKCATMNNPDGEGPSGRFA